MVKTTESPGAVVVPILAYKGPAVECETYSVFALVEGTDALVDLDELPKTKLATVTLRGEQVGIETISFLLCKFSASSMKS